MKRLILLFLAISFGCKLKNTEVEVTKTKEFELLKANNEKALLILFPGGGGNPENIKREFKIVEKAKENGVSLLMMNFARKLWIEDEDCKSLTNQIKTIIKEHKLNTDNIYVGGMSIGGNVTLTLTQYLLKNNELNIQGAFVVDPPLDLYGLYKSSQKDLKRTDFSEERLAEPKWIISFFEEKFGEDNLLANIKKVSPFTSEENNIKNITELKNIKFRMYIEPDKQWWKEVRNTDFESANGYYIQKLAKILQKKQWKKAELIETKNKGYRFNGDRNPHSWSIVNIDNLFRWMLA